MLVLVLCINLLIAMFNARYSEVRHTDPSSLCLCRRPSL